MSKTLAKFLSVARLMNYQLPGKPGDQYIVGVSGGADSSCTAAVLKSIFPDVEFQYIYTDTGEEVEGTEASIQNLEQFLGQPIRNEGYPGGLYELIHSMSNSSKTGLFLPSSQSRFCTRILKIERMENVLESMRGDSDVTYHNFVGLRADEPARDGMNSDMPWLVSHFPLRDLGINRADVFNILEETGIGIPSFYRTRSRSGCTVCIFQRQSEMLGALETTREAFFKASSFEKLTKRDQERFEIEGSDWSSLHVNAPVPQLIDIRTADDFELAPDITSKVSEISLFSKDRTEVFVGIEYFVDPTLSLYGNSRNGTSGVWWSGVIGWGSRKQDIATKMNTHYWTRHDTCEVWGLDEASFKQQYKMGVIHLSIPNDLVDLKKCSKKTYSWVQDSALQKIRFNANIIKKTLHKLSLFDALQEFEPYQGTETWEGEQYDGFQNQLARFNEKAGDLINLYAIPPKARPAPKTGDKAPCFVCSK